MPGLVEYQRQFFAGLLGLPGHDPELAALPAMEVHRRTVLAALTNALALSFPTIRKLTGDAYFETLVRGFARQHPPRNAVLYDYGAELPAFLAAFPGAEGYPYFRAVADFDWILDQTAHCAPHLLEPPLAIPGGGSLCLPTSLTCIRFDYAVDLIRDAVEAEREDELARLDVGRSLRWLVVWRSPGGASVKALSERAWNILADLRAGYDGASALERANCDAAEALYALRHEILTSSFVAGKANTSLGALPP